MISMDCFQHSYPFMLGVAMHEELSLPYLSRLVTEQRTVSSSSDVRLVALATEYLMLECCSYWKQTLLNS